MYMDAAESSGVEDRRDEDNDPKVGTVIGKALESKSDDHKGVIEIVVGRV